MKFFYSIVPYHMCLYKIQCVLLHFGIETITDTVWRNALYLMLDKEIDDDILELVISLSVSVSTTKIYPQQHPQQMKFSDRTDR